ncbi:hypothetical protein [Paenibacillus spongiae]|uniref:Uncharacterized protein n=1 Tax=Paenibacillus spongiae TaxID=2909671 RepID=A0ABY5S4C9_9BACL|nr:hypothetical protein [Paenibacillus spongiae]UVI28736.1 hypothetical protein L1F29_25340 [Paenibacillus spongiae]
MDERIMQIVERLRTRKPLQSLSPNRIWDEALDQEIAAIRLPNADTAEAIALKAGLHLWNDSLDISHSYAQLIEHDPTGGYWHGLMHRMERDYSNAKYWFRQAGAHPVMDRLQQRASSWLRAEANLEQLPEGEIREMLEAVTKQGRWNSAAFTDGIARQEQRRGSDTSRQLLEELQHMELTELVAYTLDAAKGR